MAPVEIDNVFVKRLGLNTYRALTVLSWLFVVILCVLLSFVTLLPSSPDWTVPTIWAVNEIHQTMFALSRESVCVFWYALYLFQLVYIYFLCFGDKDYVNKAAEVDAHFIFYNLLNATWIFCWVYSQFWIGEVCLAINLLHLWSMYLAGPHNNRFAHAPIVAGPFAWTFFALFMNGAAMFHGHNEVTERLAYVFLWAIFFVGISLVVSYKDHALGFCCAILMMSLGAQQYHIGLHNTQVVSAFLIAALFFITSAALAVLEALGKEFSIRRADEEAGETEEAAQDWEATENGLLRDDSIFERRYNQPNAEAGRPVKDDDGREFGYNHPIFMTEDDEAEHARLTS